MISIQNVENGHGKLGELPGNFFKFSSHQNNKKTLSNSFKRAQSLCLNDPRQAKKQTAMKHKNAVINFTKVAEKHRKSYGSNVNQVLFNYYTRLLLSKERTERERKILRYRIETRSAGLENS